MNLAREIGQEVAKAVIDARSLDLADDAATEIIEKRLERLQRALYEVSVSEIIYEDPGRPALTVQIYKSTLDDIEDILLGF